MWNPDDEKELKRRHEEERLNTLQRQRESFEVAARKALVQKLKASRRFERSQNSVGLSSWAASVASARSRDDLATRFIPKRLEVVKTGAVLRQSSQHQAINSIRSSLISALGKRS